MNQTVETFLRIYIDFDQRNWVKFLFITEFVIHNKDAVSTGFFFFFFFFTDTTRKFQKRLKKLTQPAENHVKIPIQKTDNIFTKLKQTNDWVQTVMAVPQQKQQKYADTFKAQIPKYKI